jgi:hypothetical protein
MCLVAAALVLARSWLAALVGGGVLIVVASVVALRGWRALPRNLLGRTKERIESNWKGLRERLA